MTVRITIDASPEFAQRFFEAIDAGRFAEFRITKGYIEAMFTKSKHPFDFCFEGRNIIGSDEIAMIDTYMSRDLEFSCASDIALLERVYHLSEIASLIGNKKSQVFSETDLFEIGLDASLRLLEMSKKADILTDDCVAFNSNQERCIVAIVICAMLGFRKHTEQKKTTTHNYCSIEIDKEARERLTATADHLQQHFSTLSSSDRLLIEARQAGRSYSEIASQRQTSVRTIQRRVGRILGTFLNKVFASIQP